MGADGDATRSGLEQFGGSGTQGSGGGATLGWMIESLRDLASRPQAKTKRHPV